MKSLLHLGFLLLFIVPLHAQTKQIKRPKKAVGIGTVDRFVDSSFDLYEKVYQYDGYAEAGRELEDDDLDVLEEALDDAKELSLEAPDVLGSLEGQNVLKQGKATLQLNKSKKALKYCIKTIPTLLRSRNNTAETEDAETSEETNNTQNQGTNDTSQSSESTANGSSSASTFKINSKFDFVPGDEILFFDDFSSDFIGDFPSKWNTNGGGEVVTINDDPHRWLQLIPGSGTFYLPDAGTLPEEYTVEFDILTSGIDKKTSSTARLKVYLDTNNTFRRGNEAYISIPLVQFIAGGVVGYSQPMGINNTIQSDIRQAVLNKPHIAIAVNKQRLRFWVNDKKFVDIPRFLPQDGSNNSLKFNLYGTKDGKENVFISNLKIAEGGIDLRRVLLSEGRVSTNGILFDSGSAVIQPQSYGILRQISQVLQQDQNIKLNIIGHTDGDGDDASNLTLSRKRAQAVKTALQTTYSIDSNRLAAEGKGASQPVADNNSPNGKAQNRRVEFIRQ